MGRNGFFNKITAVLLFVIFALASFSVTLTASAAAPQLNMQTFGYISEYEEFYQENKELVDLLANEIYEMKTSVNVSAMKVPVTIDANKLLTVIDRTHPELFFLDGFGANMYSTNGRDFYIYCIFPSYRNTPEEVAVMRQEFYSRARYFLRKVDNNMSDFDKALILHDELALYGSYLITGETYDFMVNAKGKCYGYSEVYSFLLAQVGVKTEIVESGGPNGMGHQWNKVCIDGVYYNVDLTWDDPLPDKPGIVRHTLFLLSDAAIQGLQTDERHYGYTSSFTGGDTRFDNYDFHHFNTKLFPTPNGYYVMDNINSSSHKKEFVIYNLATDSSRQIRDYKTSYWRGGLEGGYVWSDGYTALVEEDGYLYLNGPSTLYVFDAEEEHRFIMELPLTYNTEVFGLKILDDKLYAALTDNPNHERSLSYIMDCLHRVRPTEPPTTEEPTTEEPTTEEPTTVEPTTAEPTTAEPTTAEPTTAEPTTAEPTTAEPTTAEPTTAEPTTAEPTTAEPTTAEPTTAEPTTAEPTTAEPTTAEPTTAEPTTAEPTTVAGTTAPSVPERLRGDVDNDGRVSIKDVTIIQRYLAAYLELTDDEWNMADVDFDGNVTINDATMIQQVVAEIISFLRQ